MQNGRKRFTTFIILVLVGVFAFSSVVLEASGQESSKTTIGDLLSDFLNGGDKGQAKQVPDTNAGRQQPIGPARRLPFGRQQMQLSFAPLVKETAPAVVNVYASSHVQAQSPFMGDPFFEQFFGNRMPPRVQKSLGSGVLVDPSGIIVTNNHVVDNADEVRVALPDGREFDAKLLLKDESFDLAVLKIDGSDPFPTVAIGDSDALEVGDLVLAIGNPFGVGQTVTSGIVSAVARTHLGISDFGFFIQTDAAINPGNSGGPLIDMQGRLVGINTAIFSRSGGSVGIGFAIPSNMVRAFVASAESGKDFFERPYLGATLDPVTPQIAEALGMSKPFGALVSNVAADGPADAAGLKPGDVIVAMDGKPIEHRDALDYRLATEPVGDTIQLEVLRNGKRETLEVKLESAPKGKSAELTIDGRGPFSGATVADLSPYLAQKLRLPASEKGVAVVDVARGSPAAGVGIRPRDIVRDINGETVDSAEKLKQLAESDGRWWRFTIERDGRLLQQMLRY